MANRGKHPQLEVITFDDYTSVQVTRGRKTHEFVRLGANKVHAIIEHPDGSIEDLGVSENLLTNIGRDVLADVMGGKIPAGGQGSPMTASSATSATGTGSVWTASNLATPQLGLIGLRVIAPITNITTAPVYGNIVSNTTNVITIDQWWTGVDGVGTTPASTNAFILGAGGGPAFRFMGLTTDSGAASATNTALTTEQTTNGGNRSLATYAHTYGASTYTLTKAFAITGTITAIHRGGLFPHNSQTGVGPLVFETVLNQDATVGNGDTLTVTWTVTLSG